MKQEIKIFERKPFNPLISVVLPSRKRINGLAQLIESVYNLADKDKDNFEFILKLDDDDVETIQHFLPYVKEIPHFNMIISSKKHGWLSMCDFVEECIRLANGKWILSVNDDMVFKTFNWNSILEKHLKNSFFRVYHGRVNGYPESFPIFPKKWYELLGHISPHNQIDTYIDHIVAPLGIKEFIDEIQFIHYQDKIIDETHLDKAKVVDINFNSRDFYVGSEIQQRDIKIIHEYIQNGQ